MTTAYVTNGLEVFSGAKRVATIRVIGRKRLTQYMVMPELGFEAGYSSFIFDSEFSAIKAVEAAHARRTAVEDDRQLAAYVAAGLGEY